MSRRQVLFFRVLFVTSVVGVTYFALTGVKYPVVADVNDKLQHVAAFFTLGLLLDFSFPERPFRFAKFGSLLAYGILLELVQAAAPARVPSVWDVAADGAGLLLYVTSTPLLRRVPILQQRWRS